MTLAIGPSGRQTLRTGSDLPRNFRFLGLCSSQQPDLVGDFFLDNCRETGLSGAGRVRLRNALVGDFFVRNTALMYASGNDLDARCRRFFCPDTGEGRREQKAESSELPRG